MLGIDIGASSVKVVELSRWGGGRTLENYGEIKSSAFFQAPFRSSSQENFLLSSDFVAKAITAVIKESRIKTKSAVFSIPDFSTFFVSFDLPPIEEREISDAIRFNAPQYIPLPISETTLDWKIISGVPGDKKSKLKVLVAAVANQVVQEYQRVAQMAGLELFALEAEALAAVRALVPQNKKTICLVDIGAQSTTVNIVDAGILRKSYSFDFAGNQLSYVVASAIDKGYSEAEQVKQKQGLLSQDKRVSDTLYMLIDPLLVEIRKVSGEFTQFEGKEVTEVYLTGGTANLPGLKEYFSEALKRKTEVPNCFANFLYPPILSGTLQEMAPRYSVAVGVALQGLQ